MRYSIKILLLTIFIVVLSAAHNVVAQGYVSDNWFPIQVDGKYGFIERTGKIVLEPQFEAVRGFTEGIAAARSGGKWGLIDRTGKFILEPKFDWIDWGEKLPPIIAASIDGKVGGIDKTGNVVIQPIYEMVNEMSDGLIAVKLSDVESKYSPSWIYINAEGKQAFDKRFYGAGSFVNGRAFVKIGFDEWAIIDTSGNKIGERHFDSNVTWNAFSEGLTAVRVKNKWGYVDRDGKFVIKPRFDDADNFFEGLATVKVGCFYGFIDKSGKFVIPPKFALAARFSEGFAAVVPASQTVSAWEYTRKGKTFLMCDAGLGPSEPEGYIDRTGKIVIEAKFGRAFPFRNGLAQISFGEPPDVIGYVGKRGYIDKTGKYIWEPTK